MLGDITMENTRFCNKCGKEIPVNSEFCPYCGTSQPKIQTDKNEAKSEPVEAEPSKQSVQNNIEQPTPVENSQTGNNTHIGIGWLCAAVSLFVPIVGVAGIILGALALGKSEKKTAAIVLIVFSCLFMYFGFTGFGTGFINGINGR